MRGDIHSVGRGTQPQQATSSESHPPPPWPLIRPLLRILHNRRYGKLGVAMMMHEIYFHYQHMISEVFMIMISINARDWDRVAFILASVICCFDDSALKRSPEPLPPFWFGPNCWQLETGLINFWVHCSWKCLICNFIMLEGQMIFQNIPA